MNDACNAPSLCKAYAPYFRIGAAVNSWKTDDPVYRELICRHFSSVTAENEMKPLSVLDREATVKLGDGIHTVQNFENTDKLLAFARDNGIKVRFHVLCWHGQTPIWFFTEGWQDIPFKQLIESNFSVSFAPKELILQRLECYIQDVMTHVNTAFPGVVYAWDVVNEAIDPDQGNEKGYREKSPWAKAVGAPEFILAAFRAARKYKTPEQQLYYNDYECYNEKKLPHILELLRLLKEEKLVDGMGMQAHLGMEYPDIEQCEKAARAYGALGLSLQVTELDIHCPDGTAAGQQALAERYAAYFDMLLRLKRDGTDVNSVTFWGLSDRDSWLPAFRKSESYPLLFTGELKTKPAYDAVLAAAAK